MHQSISEEFRKKFPCIQSGCDSNGTIAEHGCNGINEDCETTCPVPVQCQYCYEVRFPIESFLKSKISQAIAEERKRLREKVEEMKTDERKVAKFGEWQAETYNDKMLVNAVLDQVIALIKENNPPKQ